MSEPCWKVLNVEKSFTAVGETISVDISELRPYRDIGVRIGITTLNWTKRLIFFTTNHVACRFSADDMDDSSPLRYYGSTYLGANALFATIDFWEGLAGIGNCQILEIFYR